MDEPNTSRGEQPEHEKAAVGDGAAATTATPEGDPERPLGPIAWARRRGLPWIGRGSAVLGLVVLGLWLTGRILTDEYRWSQYLFWIPTLWAGAAALLAWLVSWIAGLLSTRMGGDLLRPFLLVAAIAVLGWMGLIEWRGVNLVRAVVDADEPSTRVLFWNNASRSHLYGAEVDLEALGADIAVIVSPTAGPREREKLRTALERSVLDSVLDDATAAATALPTHRVQRAGLWIYTRQPMLAWGESWLRVSEGADAGWRTAGYGGRAVWVQLDMTSVFGELATPFTVWVIDLPSDPSLHKAEPAREARRAIEAFRGTVYAPDGAGGWRGSGLELPGFPAPDVVVGDFNSPRGSASLATIIGVMESAHSQAGLGPDVTWSQPWAWWSIDLMFVGRAFETRRFDAVPLEGHAHAAIWGDVIKR